MYRGLLMGWWPPQGSGQCGPLVCAGEHTSATVLGCPLFPTVRAWFGSGSSWVGGQLHALMLLYRVLELRVL